VPVKVRVCGHRSVLNPQCSLTLLAQPASLQTWTLDWGDGVGSPDNDVTLHWETDLIPESPRAVSVIKSFDSSVMVVMEKRRFGIFMQKWLITSTDTVPLSVYNKPPPPLVGPLADEIEPEALHWLGGVFIKPGVLLMYDTAARTFTVDCAAVSAWGAAQPMYRNAYVCLLVSARSTTLRARSHKNCCYAVHP